MALNFRFTTAQSGRESSSLLKYAKNAGKFFATISGILPAIALTSAVAWGFLYCVNQVEAYAIKLPDGFKQYIYKPAWDFLDKSAQNCLFKSMEWMVDPFTDSAQDFLNEASYYAESVGYGNSAEKTISSEDEKLIKDKGAAAVSPMVKKASRFTRDTALFTIGSLINAFKVPGKEYDHSKKRRENAESLHSEAKEQSSSKEKFKETNGIDLDGLDEEKPTIDFKQSKKSDFLPGLLSKKVEKPPQARDQSFANAEREKELLDEGRSL
jgi:hypothetical protein